jgi:hypothetical protein
LVGWLRPSTGSETFADATDPIRIGVEDVPLVVEFRDGGPGVTIRS